MNYLLTVNFSAGLAAVLLGAAAIILIVMVAEAVCMVRLQKVRGSGKPEAAPSGTPPLKKLSEKACGSQPQQLCESPEKPAEKAPLTESDIAGGELQPAVVTDEKPRKSKPSAREKTKKGVYDKSFSARLIMSGSDTKNQYSSLKNELLKSGFQSRICWRYESFRAVKKLAAKLTIRSGGLCLLCALEPDKYVSLSDAVQDLSDKKTYKNTPLLCAADKDGEEIISKRLIAALAIKSEVERAEYEECDFAALLPYEECETLVERGLIKVKKRSKKIKVKQVENIAVKAEKSVLKTGRKNQKKSIEKTVKKSVKKVVNTDVIFSCFNEGEIATLDEIKKRIFGNNVNITYIKILGRGKADKKITVIANAFSRTAEKNILEAGGKVIIKKR